MDVKLTNIHRRFELTIELTGEEAEELYMGTRRGGKRTESQYVALEGFGDYMHKAVPELKLKQKHEAIEKAKKAQQPPQVQPEPESPAEEPVPPATGTGNKHQEL